MEQVMTEFIPALSHLQGFLIHLQQTGMSQEFLEFCLQFGNNL
jgi:hypothetical protein